MTPFRENHRLSELETNYNRKISATRCVIERAFALLKGRFRRLKYLDMNVKYVPATILACCALHNICLNENNADFLAEGGQNENEDGECNFKSN